MSEPTADPAVIEDRAEKRYVASSERVYEGAIVNLRVDKVDLGDGDVVTRELVEHPGAVGVIALDEQDRVLLVHQYRHPVGALLWEPPAGLLDIPGEDPLDAVKRELYEEASYRASEWHVLVDLFNSPGGTDESIRVYLARGLTPVGEHERHVGEGEERDMPVGWLPFEDAVTAVLAGKLHNPCAVAGLTAAAALQARGWAGLRPADAPWMRTTSRPA